MPVRFFDTESFKPLMILLFNLPNFSEFQHPYVYISREVSSPNSGGPRKRMKKSTTRAMPVNNS